MKQEREAQKTQQVTQNYRAGKSELIWKFQPNFQS